MGRLRLLTACLLALCASADSATWYVAADGDDTAAGTGPDAAWRTLGRASQSIAEGDTLLLRRGDAFREAAEFREDAADRLTFGAYGPSEAPRPVISGAVAVTGWKPYRDGIYIASVDVPIRHLFVDGKLMTIARYPNTGWLRVIGWGDADDGTNTFITCPELARHPRNAPDYWNGARIRWRRWSWWHETRQVVGDNGQGELRPAGPRRRGERDPFWTGFYLDNKLSELDAPGEWYFDPDSRTVYLYPPGDEDPNDLSIEGTRREQGLVVNRATVRDITFRHQTQVGLKITGASTVSDCRFEGIDGAALQATWGCGNSVVRGCTFTDSINNAIVWNENPQNAAASLIEGNTFLNTGMVPGYEARGAWHAVAICIYNGSNTRVRYNTIDGTGYSGMFIQGYGTVVECNRVRRAMWTLNDGAGIYACTSFCVLRNNIITDTRGNEESAQRIPYGGKRDYEHSWPWANLGHGIWLEFIGDYGGSIVEGNTCANSGAFGLFLPNNFELNVRDNVLYNNARAAMQLSGFETYERTGRVDDLPQNHRITDNVLFAAAEGQASLLFRPQFDYGFMGGNYVCAPYSEAPLKVTGVGRRRYQKSWLTVGEWQRQFSWADRAPRTDLTRPDEDEAPGDFSRLVVNDAPERRDMPLGEGIYYDPDGRILAGRVSLAPYSSTVLVRCRPPELVPTERMAPAAGRHSWVAVAAKPETTWEARSDVDWIIIVKEPKSHSSGIGAVRYIVRPNTETEPRTGTLTVAGRTHTVVQAGSGDDSARRPALNEE